MTPDRYFATGVYLDVIRTAGNDLKFAKRLVVCDSSRIDTLAGAAAVSAMAFTVTVANRNTGSPASRTSRCLDAAQRAGLEVPFSCRKGVCGTCKGRIVSGRDPRFCRRCTEPGRARRGPGAVLATPGRVRTWSSRRVRSARPIHFARKTTTATGVPSATPWPTT